MTSAAGLSEPASVNVITPVTTAALHGHVDLVLYRFPMAGITLEFLVLPRQVEIRIIVMTEAPDVPAVGVVTGDTRFAQLSLMVVLGFMTAHALHRCLPIPGSRVAFLAGDNGVKTD